jgi:hypothetical protein
MSITLLSLAAGCGGVQTPERVSEADMRSIVEARAIELIEQTLAEGRIERGQAMTIDLGRGEERFEVDVRLGNGSYGIEFVTSQDRSDWGDAIPPQDPEGQLRIMPGLGDDANVQVLVLDHRQYRFDPDLERVQRGSTGVREAEGRLQRDVRDYIEYVRAQGGP